MLSPFKPLDVTKILSIVAKDGTWQPYNPSCCLQFGTFS